MNNRIKIALLIVLVAAQFIIFRFYYSFRFNVDLLFLIILYVTVTSTYLKGMITATLIGLAMDFFSGGILGVFSFSRALAAFFLHRISRFLDLRKNVFLFLLIFIPLLFSNCVANLFFYFIFRFHLTTELILMQPLLTAAVGTLLAGNAKVKKILNVY